LWLHERLQMVYAMLERLGSPKLDPLVQEFIRPEFERLIEEINTPQTTHFRRAAIGDRLAVIGDTRPGVGLREDGLPDIVWCEIPDGEIMLEGTLGTQKITRLAIAKYPVTYLQYRSFIHSEDGYKDPRWWGGLARYAEEPGRQNRPTDNHPAENVSWYDAIAFCRWLTEKMGYPIRLPTEWEWQAAAAYNDTSLFPWGSTWNTSACVTRESGISRTTAVGMYPQGASKSGVMDMSGNVSEWCLNEFMTVRNTEVSGMELRTLRGGSWGDQIDFARVTLRNSGGPAQRSKYIGFRLCRDR
jgi:formylglycine-generating enzyme required for sulfatase activity